mgnify:FL=1
MVGDALLTEILDTATCYLGGVAGLRLSRGKAHALEWHWQLLPDGQQRLLPTLPHGQRLLRLGALWYLDAERAELGLLQGSAEEAHLLDAPPLPPHDSGAFSQALPNSPLAKRIPPPRVSASAKHATWHRRRY